MSSPLALALCVFLAGPSTKPAPQPTEAETKTDIEYPFAGPRTTSGQAQTAGATATGGEASKPGEASPPSSVDFDRKAKTKRIIGIGLMVGGGVATLAGAGLLVAASVMRNKAHDNLTRDLEAQDEANCPIGSNTGSCGELERNIETWRSDEDKAQKNVVIGGVVLGLGLVAALSGGIVYAVGRYAKRPSTTARVVLEPRGLGLAGRF